MPIAALVKPCLAMIASTIDRPLNRVRHDHKRIFLRRKVAMIARGEFQPMMLGDRRLYRVGEFPAFATAQRGGAIGLSRIRQGRK